MDRIDFLNGLNPNQRVQYIVDDFVPLSALYEVVYTYDKECTIDIVTPYIINITVVTGNVNQIISRLTNMVITAYDKKYKLYVTEFNSKIEAKLIEVSV